MVQIQFINQVLEWERRLEIEDEKRKNARLEPYRELPLEPQPVRMERRSFFSGLVRIFQAARDRQPARSSYEQECRSEGQPG